MPNDKKKRKRGPRSAASSAKRNKKWLDSQTHADMEARWVAKTTIIDVKSSELGLVLPPAPETGRLFYKFEDIPGVPSGLLMRFDKVTNKKVSQKILAAYDDLLQKGLVFPDPDAALQIGVWKTSLDRAHCQVTANFRGPIQTKEVMNAVDHFLQLINNIDITPRILTFMGQDFLGKYPDLTLPAPELEGALFTISIRKETSERLDIHFRNDSTNQFWVVPLGDWEKAELCVTQLGVNIPVRPGQILGFM